MNTKLEKEKVEKAAKGIDNCCICGDKIIGYGNNPYPVKTKGRCCDICNNMYVIPMRMGFKIKERGK